MIQSISEAYLTLCWWRTQNRSIASVEFKIILVEGMLGIAKSISEAYLTLCWWRTQNRSIASVEFKIILVEGMLISPYLRHT